MSYFSFIIIVVVIIIIVIITNFIIVMAIVDVGWFRAAEVSCE